MLLRDPAGALSQLVDQSGPAMAAHLRGVAEAALGGAQLEAEAAVGGAP